MTERTAQEIRSLLRSACKSLGGNKAFSDKHGVSASYVSDLLDERHPTMTVEIKGTRIPIGRYETTWSIVEEYEPSSAEQLAKNRARREERQFQQEVKTMPLFSEDLQNERAIQQGKRTQGRRSK